MGFNAAVCPVKKKKKKRSRRRRRRRSRYKKKKEKLSRTVSAGELFFFLSMLTSQFSGQWAVEYLLNIKMVKTLAGNLNC